MGFRDTLADLVANLTGISDATLQVHTGTLALAFLTIMAACVCICAVILFLSLRLRKPLQDPQVQLVAGLRGKIEKIEKSLNELNTERARAQQFYQLEFDYLKNELEILKAKSGMAVDPEREGVDTLMDPNYDTDQPVAYDPPESTDSNATPIFDLGTKKNESTDDVKKKSNDQELAEKKGPELQLVKDEKPQTADLPEGTPAERSLNNRLSKTRQGFFAKLKDLFGVGNKLSSETIEELEAILIGSDLGTKTTDILIEELKAAVKNQKNVDQKELLSFLRERVTEILDNTSLSSLEITAEAQSDGPKIVMLVGVNGTGKTTSVAKLTRQWTEQGKKVLMVAADTFRAAATDQLQVWAERLNVEIVTGAIDAKPQTVVFDAMTKAKSEKYDVIVIDTAGRLHNKSNLMQELEGVKNIIKRHQPSAPHEVILVVDGTSGQNALVQAKEFNQATQLTGIIVTKLDGSAKGGIVVAIKNELDLPVRYIGVGESYNDLRPFKAAEFAEALFAA